MKVIKAISFLYKGERVLIKANLRGKFRVPVTEVKNGSVQTRNRALSAREVIEHEIIKNCDPTFYLDGNHRHRVFLGGDPSYLPAASEGIIIKHDGLYEEKKIDRRAKSLRNSPIYLDSYDNYMQTGLWGWPGDYDDP